MIIKYNKEYFNSITNKTNSIIVQLIAVRKANITQILGFTVVREDLKLMDVEEEEAEDRDYWRFRLDCMRFMTNL